jgi:hypothetical protein
LRPLRIDNVDVIRNALEHASTEKVDGLVFVAWPIFTAQEFETDCVAGHVGLEPANVILIKARDADFSIISPSASIPAARQNRSKLAATSSMALATGLNAAGGKALADVILLFPSR